MQIFIEFYVDFTNLMQCGFMMNQVTQFCCKYPSQQSNTFSNQCLPLLYRKSTFLNLRFGFWMCSNVLSKAKKVCFIFSPTWSPLCGSFLSYVTKQKGKKWRKLIKGSIFWSKISKKDYLQQGDNSFMFKNRQNRVGFFQFWQENKKIDCNQLGSLECFFQSFLISLYA